MPKKDLNDLGGLLGDLWKELSPVVRTFLFLGLAGGVLTGVLLLFGLPSDYSVRLAGRILIWVGLGLVVAGGVLGLLAGVVVETVIARLRRPKKPPPSRQTWRPIARRKEP
jgi:hypothetical protein